MEMENMISCVVTSRDEDDDIPLPGFRFHPTDEELVGFYLKRKVEKRPISIELIKQIDIYKYDPSNLPKASNVGDKESYFFCKRGRKYRNSVRPNRVITGSGFWKATGIDKPIYSSAINGDQEGRDCIGLKKSLVYYRGSAGKGTKTDWMMHEFRLPAEHDMKTTKHFDAKTIAQEAEVWTLCRIFKRKVSHKKCIPNWKDEIIPGKRNPVDVSSKICSMEYSDYHRQGYINFGDPTIRQNDQKISNPLHNEIKKPFNGDHVDVSNQLFLSQISSVSQAPSATSSYSSLTSPDMKELLEHDWDELRSVVEFAADHPFVS